MNEQELKSMWREQTPALPGAMALSVQDLQQREASLRRKVALRNALEYAAGGLAITGYALYLWIFPFWLTRLGSALVILGGLVVMRELHRRGSNLPLSFASGSHLQFHRASLLRQRDALRSVWRWYLAPLLPGLLVFFLGLQLDIAGGNWHGLNWISILAYLVAVLALFGTIIALNHRAAGKAQAQIDALDQLGESP